MRKTKGRGQPVLANLQIGARVGSEGPLGA